MNLIPWRQSTQPLATLQREVNHLFEILFARWNRVKAIVVNPVIDMKEDEEVITVTAELPGVNPENVQLSIVDDMLEIKGHKVERTEHKGDNYHSVERSSGSFTRRIALPTEVDTNRAEASMEKGVLHLQLPKLETKRHERTIPVR